MKRKSPVRAGRRRALLGVGLTTLALSSARGDAHASEEEDGVEYLFVISAENARLADGRLHLTNVADNSLYFSDRPDRLTGYIATPELIVVGSEGDDSFDENPPNATLALQSGAGPTLTVLVLNNPQLEGKDLTFDVQVLEGPDAGESAPAALFVDGLGHPMSPNSVAGVRRRRRRRRRRIVHHIR